MTDQTDSTQMEPYEGVLTAGAAVHGDIRVRELADLATRAAGPHELEQGKRYVVLGTAGAIQEINLDLPEYQWRPNRPKGTTTLTEARAFIAYTNRHATTATEVFAYADLTGAAVEAVFNAHEASQDDETEGVAGWTDHRALLRFVTSPEWDAWTARDKTFLPQADFAAFIEDHLTDIRDPDGATMLEVASSLTGGTRVTFESNIRLDTGERQLTYKEETGATAGRTQSIAVPERFLVALRPFAGAERYAVSARFRYRVNGGNLHAGYALENVDGILEAAFADVVADIDANVSPDVFIGWPAGSTKPHR